MDKNTNYEMKRIGHILLRVVITAAMVIVTAAVTIGVMISCGIVVGGIACAVCVMICKAISKVVKKSGTSNIDEELLPDILRERIELKEYSSSKYFSENELRSTNIIDGFTSSVGGGYIDGSYKGIHFTRCAVTLNMRDTEEVYNTETEQYEKIISDKVIFSGYIVRTEHEFPQYAGVMACSDSLNSAAVLRKGQKLRNENGISVFSQIGDDVPLTLVRGLVTVIEETGSPAAAVMTEKYLYVIVSTPKPELSVNMLSSIKANTEKLSEQTDKLARVVERMNILI